LAVLLAFSRGAGAQVVLTSPGAPSADASLGGRIAAVSPSAIRQGATAVQVQLSGIGTTWDASTQVNFGSVITFGSPAWTVNGPSSITAVVNVPTEAPVGPQPVIVETRGQVLSASIDILSNPPQQQGTPVLLSASGATVQQGATFSTTILGQYTSFATGTTTANFGNGVTVSTVTANSPTSLTVAGSVDPLAFAGMRNIMVTTGTQVLSLTNAFTVSQGPAAITLVSPNSGTQGQVLNVALTGSGTHFSQGVTIAGFGQGIAVNTLTVNSATSATANVTIASNATAQVNSVTMTTLGEAATSANAFTITSQPAILSSLSPTSLPQGQTTTVNLTGTGTNWVNGNTAADFGAGITVNGTSIGSATAGVATIMVSPTAAIGARTVQMITNLGGGSQEVATKANGFTVTAGSAALVSATPTTPATIHQNDTNDTIAIVGSGTHFDITSTVVFCSGVTAVQTTPNSATQLTVIVNVSASAAVGSCGATVTTGGEVANGGNLFSILGGLPVVSGASPISAHQNDQNVNVTVTGLYTNFVNGTTTANFGAGVTVNSVTVSGSTTATVNVTISSTATIGGRTVTMTTGTEVASFANAFNVVAGLPQLASLSPSTGAQNSTQTVTVTGLYTNFAQGTSVVSFSGGNVTAGTATVNGPAQITVSVTVAAGAAATARTVTVTTGSEVASLTNGFTVMPGAPTITTISPTVGVPNTASLNVSLTGLFTSWVNGSTQANFGPGIAVNGAAEGAYGTITVTSATTATATIAIDPAATLGARNVVVQTPGTPAQIITVDNGFTVQSTVPTAPTVVTVTPANGSTGVPINTSFTAVFSGPINPATVTAGNAYVSRTQDGCNPALAVPAAQTVDASGRILTLTPSAVLAVGNGYYFCLDYNSAPYIKDPSGLAIGGTYDQFTTGFATSNTGPTYLEGNVANGDTVGTNVTPILGFDKAVNPGTQLSGLNVLQGSTPVGGVWSYNSVFTQATFTPAGGFTASTAYTIQLTSALTDSVGNPLVNPQTISFTTGTGADNVAATLVSYTPINNSTTGENPTIRLVYSKAINPLTVTQGQFYLYQNATDVVVPGTTVTASADRKTFTMTLSGPLDPNTPYYWYICPPYDQAQHYIGCAESNFTTGAAVDSTSPTVTLVSPPNGFTGVAVNAPIEIQLSKTIDPTTVNSMSLTLTPAVAGTVALDSTGSFITLTPSASLATSQTYTVNASGFADQDGNLVTPFSSTFTTGSSSTPDTTRGSITMAPASGATAVPTNTVVVFTFSKPFNPDSVVDGGNIRLYDSTASVYVGGSTALNSTFTTVTFTPPAALEPNHQYCGYAGYPFSGYIYDLAGNSFNYVYSQCFNTAAGADTTPPTVITVMPVNNATGIGPNNPITVTFSKPMNPGTLTNTNVALYVGSNLFSRSFSISFDNTTLTFNAGSLPYGTTFTVVVTPNVTDLANNHLASQFTSNFTTLAQPPTAVPTVTAVRPASGATGVPANASITWFISAPLKTSTVPAAVKVSQNGVLITGTITYASNSQVVVFTPSANFLPGASVVAFFTNAATDGSGNPLTNYQFSFTVAPNSTAANPTILSTVPGQNSSGAYQNSIVDVQFSKALNPSTVTAGNFYLLDCHNAPVSGTLSLLNGNTVVRFTPAAPYASGCSYNYVYATSGLQDTSGLAFAATSWSFYYTSTQDTTTPSVATIAPTNNATAIGTNSTIRIQFSEAIDAISVNTSGLTLTANSATIPWSATFDGTGTVLTLVPQAALPASTQVTVALGSAITDPAGNALTPYSSVFTTAAAPDFGTPYVMSSSVVSGQTGVPVTSVFTLTYNKPVDTRTEVSANNVISLYDYTAGVYLPITLTFSPDGTQVTIQPNSLLAVNRQFNLIACRIQDLNGNGMSPCFNIYFYTALVAPTGTPNVTFVLPPNGFQIATNVKPEIQFDRSIDTTSLSGITLKQGGAAVSFTTAGSVGDTVLTLSPNSLLAPNLPYTLSISGVKDAAGNTMAGTVTRNFTTGPSIDLVPPAVNTMTPETGETTGTNPTIRITFNKPINPISSSSSWYLRNSVTGVDFPGASIAASANLMSETISYPGALDPNTQFCWYAGYVYDLAGNQTYTGGGPCFTTSSGTVTMAPTVTGVTPPNGQTAVPIDTLVQISLSAPIDATTVGAGSLTLSPAAPASSSVALATGSQAITLNLGGSTLAANTTYTLSASGFKDLNGNAVTPFTSTFTTSSLSDTTQGTITLSSPAPGSTGISINAAITVALNKVVDPLSVVPNTFAVYANNNSNQRIPGAIVIGNGGTALTFTPIGPMPPGTPIDVYVGYSSSLYDLAGNTFNYLYNATFTTATTTELTPPTIVSVTPANGTSNVGPNAVVTLIFSKALNYNTVNSQSFTLYNGFTNLNATVSRSSDNRTVTLTATLPYSSTITVDVNTTVQDLDGNFLANPFSSTFATETQPLISTATVTQMRPSNGATGVLANDTITLYFTAPLSASTVPGGFYVSQNGVLLSGSVVVSGDGRSAVWTGPGFQNNAYVQVFFTGATDTSGNPVSSYSASFTVAAATSSTTTLVSTSPSQSTGNNPVNTVIDLQFSRGIMPSTVSAATFYIQLQGQGSPVAGTITQYANNSVLRLTPSAPLQPSTYYYVFYTSGLKDVNNTPLTAGSFYFYTEATSNGATPTVTSVAPYNGATAVGDNATIRFSFNELMDTPTINATAGGPTVTLMNGGAAIPFSTSFSSGGSYTTVTLSPYAPLPDNATLTLGLSSGITDPSAHAIAAQSITFQTGAGADFSAPYVAYSSVSNGATGVPLNATITLAFSKPLDRNTVNSSNYGSYGIYDASLGQAVSTTVSVSADGTTVTYVPAANLSAFHTYYVYAQYATDLDGNAQTNSEITFTTGGAAVTTPPTVLTSNPATSASGVPLNVLIETQFSEAVSSTTLSQITLKAGSMPVPFSSSLVFAGSTLRLTPSSLLAPNTTYTVTVQGVQDLAGNTMAGAYTFSFITGANVDNNPTPNVLSTVANGLPLTGNTNVNNVPDNPTIVITFDTPVEPAGLLSSGGLIMCLNSNTNVTYPLNVAFSADQKTITVTLPSGTLAAATEYQFRVGYNYRIRDWAGNYNSGQYYIYEFTTQ
jgi:hypothetical protein